MSAPSAAASHVSTVPHFDRNDGKRSVLMRSTVTTAGNGAVFSPSSRVLQQTPSAVTAISMALVTSAAPHCAASMGPTCPVSPISVWRPQKMRSGDSFFIASDSVYAVASVSAPENARSDNSTARAAPSLVNDVSSSAVFGGPMLSSVTVASSTRSAAS